MFDYAVVDGILPRSPMAKIKLIRYEQKHGIPLTREEEQAFIQNFFTNPDVYYQAFVFILYTGIRRSELATATMNDGWLCVSTAKQRKGMEEKIRSIPISPMLAKMLPFIDFHEIKKLPVSVLTNPLQKAMQRASFTRFTPYILYKSQGMSNST